MSLDLSQIKFTVETTELDTAVKKIETLGKSVEGLASSLGKLDKESAAANKTQAQANLLTAKAATETAKAATETAKASAITTKAQDQNTAATERLTKATREKQSVEERQEAITRNMSDGYSRGQASILATAEAAGEATVRIGELLKTQRAMQGVDPFDRSIGAATLFENRTRVLTVANDLYQQSLGFTKDQLMELGREHVRLSEQFKVQGKDIGGLDAEFQKIVQSAQRVTQSENAMASAMKNADKATIDAGKANAYIENELQKVRFALQSNNEELNRSTANSLVKFENNLKRSGLTLDQQKLKIDEYRKAQVELQKTQKANQTDYITRAVGPQITDIIVGLSTGQSPLTVMMQQGGQLRDQFGMMGIAAEDMSMVMRNAMSSMARSVLDTGKAIGGMLVGGIHDAGKAVVNFAMELTGLNKKAEEAKRLYAALGEEGFSKISNLMKMQSVAAGLVAAGLAFLVIDIIALGVAFVQVTKAQDDLTKSLVSSSAQLGLSSVDAVALAESFRGVGATSVEILTAFKQISESGKISRESLVAVAEAALILESAGGKAAEKTIEMFAKLAEKPIETLSDYAQKTGLVNQAEIARIDTLVKLGKEITATEEATKILAKATEDEAAIMLASLSDVSRLWLTVKGGISEAWRAVQEFAGSSTLMSGVKVVLQTVAVVATEVWYGIKGIGESLGGLGAIAAAVMTDIKNLDTNFTASKGMLSVIEDQDKARATSYKDSIARIMQEGKYSRDELNKTAALAATGRKETADAEKDRVAHELAMKPWREQEQKSLADNLTKQEFIKQAIDKTNKALTEGKTLRAEEIAQITKLAGADWDKSNKPKKAKLSDEQKAENKALEDYIDLMNKAVGLNKDYNNILDGLQLRKKNGKLTEEEYVKAVEELIKQQKFYTDGLAQEEKAQKAAQKAAEDHMKLVEEFTKIQTEFAANSLKNQEGIQQENSALKLRGDLLGKTAEEQKKINENYKLQGDISKINAKYDKERLELQQKYLKLQADGFDVDYDTWNAQINESVRQQGEEAKLVWSGVAMTAAESIQKEFDAIKSSITDVIVTALFDGGKAGSKKLRDQVVAAFRKNITIVIDAAVNTLMGSAASSLLGGNKEGGIGTLSNVASLASLASSIGTVGSQVVTGAMSLTNAIGTIGANATGTGISGLLASNAGFGTAAPTAMSSITGAIGAIPVWGWALMAGAAAAAIFQGGETRSGGQYTSTATSGASLISGPSGGEINGTVARQMLDVTQMGINAMFKAVGSTATIAAFTAGLESSEAGKGFAYAGGTLSTGAKFGDLNSYMNNRGNKTPEEAMAAYKTELLQATIGAIQAATDVPKTIQNIIGDTDISALTESAATALMTQISTIITSVDSLNSALTVLPFEYLKDLSFDTAAGLIAAAGGLETLSNNLSGFYDNFYTETEKTANLTNNTSKAFAALGIVMPEINQSTREWYRLEVERLGAMDLSVESNAKAYASVLGLQGAVNTLAPAFDSVGTSVSDLAESAKQAAATMVSSWASIMQARGVSSSDVTRFTAQADINAAFSQYKTTDKFGIKSAEQFQTITQDDFKNYTAEQQRLISTILVGFRSLTEATTGVQSTVQESTVQTASKVLGAFDLLNASLALQATLAEASGDLIQAENVQSQQRAIILAGLNEQDPTGLLSSLQIAIYSLGDAAKQTAKDVALASTRMSWQDKVNAITQDPVALSASRAYAKQRDLAGTDDPFTKALIELSYQYEDDVAARKKQTDLMALQDEAMQNYLDAQTNVLNAQKEYASVLKGTIESMKDFLSTLNGASTPLESTAKAREAFGGLAKRASTGDTSVYSELAPAARVFLDLSKSYSRTIQDYRRDEAAVRRTMNSVIQVNTAELAKLPSEVSAASDPTKEALNALRVAQEEQTRAGTVVAAMSVNQAESLARLNGSTDSLTSRYLELIATLPNGDALKSEFDTVMDKAVGDKLPEESPFTFKDVFKGVLGDKLPDGFFGVAFSAEDIFKNAINGYIASLPRSTGGGSSSSTIPTGGTVALNPVGSSYAGMGSDIKTIQDLYSVNLGREGDAAGVAFWSNAFMGDGVISAEERQLFAISAMSEYKSKLPTFAVGTNSVPTDMLASIHAGERIIPAADNTELMQRLSSPQGDNTELLGQLVMLNSRVKSLETSMIAGQVAIADNTRKTKNILEKFDIDGLPKERV